MSDLEFAVIAPHLPGQPKRGRKRRVCLRSVISGVFYVLQNGCAWANLPKDFPPKSTVYGYFRRFLEDGTRARIHDALYVDCRGLEGREPQPTVAIIDSQSARTGPNALGEIGYDAPLGDALHRLPAMGKKVKGRKRHIPVDTVGLLLRCDVHSAGVQDRDGACRLFDRLTMRFPFLQVIFAPSQRCSASPAGQRMVPMPATKSNRRLPDPSRSSAAQI